MCHKLDNTAVQIKSHFQNTLSNSLFKVFWTSEMFETNKISKMVVFRFMMTYIGQ